MDRGKESVKWTKEVCSAVGRVVIMVLGGMVRAGRPGS